MSKILKRPMFRGGGKVNSVGTGITSGLVDREEYQYGGRTGGTPTLNAGGKTILDYIMSGSGGTVGQRGRLGVSDYIQPSGVYGGQSLTDVLGYEPTGKPYQGQPSFRSMNTPDVYTPPATETEPQVTARQAEDESMKKLDEQAGEINLDDIEEQIKKKAELYNKLLYGPEEKAQTGFRALTRFGTKALEEGDLGAAAEQASEELEKGRKEGIAGKKIAIEQYIKKDMEKDPAKKAEVEYLVGKGMSFDDAVKTVYGGEKSPYLSAYSMERFLQERTTDYSKQEQAKIVRDNATGYAMADYLQIQYPGLGRINYVNNQPDFSSVRANQVYFDPVQRKFVAKKEDGSSDFFSTYEAATQFLTQ